MIKQEASAKYNIPIEILDEYESWGLCGEVKKIKEKQLENMDYLRHKIKNQK